MELQEDNLDNTQIRCPQGHHIKRFCINQTCLRSSIVCEVQACSHYHQHRTCSTIKSGQLIGAINLKLPKKSSQVFRAIYNMLKEAIKTFQKEKQDLLSTMCLYGLSLEQIDLLMRFQKEEASQITSQLASQAVKKTSQVPRQMSPLPILREVAESYLSGFWIDKQKVFNCFKDIKSAIQQAFQCLANNSSFRDVSAIQQWSQSPRIQLSEDNRSATLKSPHNDSGWVTSKKPIIELELDIPARWSIKILKSASDIRVGIHYKKKGVKGNSSVLEQSGKIIDGFNSYVIEQSGKIIIDGRTSEEKGFVFAANDTIHVSYYPLKKRVTFIKNLNEAKCVIQTQVSQSKYLFRPCVYLTKNGDAVAFVNTNEKVRWNEGQ